jgi:dihydroxyacetone kinase DhaKLM complex PTS-EIIA-like component DhaM
MAGTSDEALVGLVIVSHSASIADGVAELVAQLAQLVATFS